MIRETGALALLALLPAVLAAQVAGSGPEEDARVVLITGSTSGLGREVALTLAASGDHVIVHGRSLDRGRALVAQIVEAGGSARFYAADFASLDAVRDLAARIRADYRQLDVLINNAGIWLDGDRQLSKEGHELHFQVNYLAGFVLTELLLPLLRESEPSRIVNVSSIAQAPIDFDDIMLETGYSDGRAYAQSKLAQIMYTFELAERLKGSKVSVNALHPATMMDTPMVLSRGARPRASVEEGEEAVLHLVNGEGLGSGLYFDGLEARETHEQAHDESAVRRLITLSREWAER